MRIIVAAIYWIFTLFQANIKANIYYSIQYYDNSVGGNIILHIL